MAQRNYGRDIIVMSNRQPALVNCWLQFHCYKNSEGKKKMINKYSPWEDIDKEKMRTRKDKVKWILKFLDLCVLWTCAVSYWEEVRRSLCCLARVARGDAWMMPRVRSITGSDSHFHCAPGVGQLQYIQGHIAGAFWSFCPLLGLV